jgi:hypothetical protein
MDSAAFWTAKVTSLKDENASDVVTKGGGVQIEKILQMYADSRDVLERHAEQCWTLYVH